MKLGKLGGYNETSHGDDGFCNFSERPSWILTVFFSFYAYINDLTCSKKNYQETTGLDNYKFMSMNELDIELWLILDFRIVPIV